MENITREEFYVARLEDCCYNIKCAFTDSLLKLPEKDVIIRYLYKLADVSSVEHVMGLLHQCWLYANPYYLFDQLPKGSDQVELIENIFKHSDREDMLKLEVDKPEGYTALHIKHYKAIESVPGLKNYYTTYLNGIFDAAKEVCSKFVLELQEGFLIDYSLHSELSADKLSAAFDVLLQHEYLQEADRAAFLAIFDSTINTRPKKITWRGISEKSRPDKPVISYASLFVAFKCLVDMDARNKVILCRCFYDALGKDITPDKLKVRDSNALDAFEAEIKEAIK